MNPDSFARPQPTAVHSLAMLWSDWPDSPRVGNSRRVTSDRGGPVGWRTAGRVLQVAPHPILALVGLSADSNPSGSSGRVARLPKAPLSGRPR